ncbi:hypothetical protein M758_1G142000 [Ceratodon purpureus]|nr:hypothetical protein M758_1G142000 [Ceratodon purpureus]KAG0629952.1 hypothetical protein M758_1G142000 [Ceratodon purpureus]
MSVVLLASAVIVIEGVVAIGCTVFAVDETFLDSEWLKLLGLASLNPWESSSQVFLVMVPQFAVALTAACALYHEQHSTLQGSVHTYYADEDVFHWRANLISFVLPSVQLVAGVARPSWIALPYFIFSCAGLLHWSMTNNFVGLSRGWRLLMYCTGMHIMLQYLYQLPVSFPQELKDTAEYIGLFKCSLAEMGWPEAVQSVALIGFFMLLCVAVNDLDEDHRHQVAESSDTLPTSYSRNARSFNYGGSDSDLLTESLLPSDQGLGRRESMNSRRRLVEQRRIIAFQHATINFFTYGFPICMVALVCWSFVYASLCAFALLLYVGYIFFAFPTASTLQKLNPVLLGFILLYALTTYFFNAAFSIVNSKFDLGTEIWHLIGLWHYSTPGLFIFAQYILGLLVATDIFVSNNILHNLGESESSSGEDMIGTLEEEREDKKLMVLAVVAWVVRRSAHVISLILIFNVGMKDGLLHAVYMGFFLSYLLSSSVAKATRQSLILLCELHFALLYLLQLDWISAHLAEHSETLKPIFSLLGIWHTAKIEDFVGIAVLLVFSSVQNHGLKVASSLSAAVQQSPQPPLGWGILRTGNGRSILLSVYASTSFNELQQESDASAHWVTKFLATTGEKIRGTYHMFSTYIAYGTVLLVVFSVVQNYLAFGYLFLLLFWIIGRQVAGKTEERLWYPLLVYSAAVFIVRYILSAFPILQQYVDARIPLQLYLGFDPAASLFQHLWDPLAILIVMEVYKFERNQKALAPEDAEERTYQDGSNFGFVGLVKRLLILHTGKLLSIAVFYAAITPVSALGFFYLIMLVVTCNMSKTSPLPGQTYVLYTSLIIMIEYLYQMWGQNMELFPGQVHGEFAYWLGLRVFEAGFWGLELGLRSRVIVLMMCILKCTTLGWYELLPASFRVDEHYGEPCLLFAPYLRRVGSSVRHSGITEPLLDKTQKRGPISEKQPVVRSQSFHPTSTSESDLNSTSVVRPKQPVSGSNLNDANGRPKLEAPWGSLSESRKWTRRGMLLLRQERYEAQLRTLSVIFKHRIEHFCQLYGLELSMLALLLSSFALLNIFSLFYIFILALCIMLQRRTLRVLWPLFVVMFACIMVTEYAVLGRAPPPWTAPSLHAPDSHLQCVQCWSSYTSHNFFCWQCWLGLTVDDRQMLVAHFVVFIVACFQLHANMAAGVLDPRSLHAGILPASDRLAWKEISYETTAQWTWLDYLRFAFYRHLLHVVLLLVFITGTLQYDVLHLGYLAMSLIFFRMRGTIMQRRNTIFRFLRLYNFTLIVASLTYQAPYFGFGSDQTCTLPQGLLTYIGLYKYDHGFRITERSALVDITIFCLVGLQAHIFRSREFEQVLRYLEAQQVEARAHAQEDKAAWKKEQLQRIREMEERKHHRREQVDKMKHDMLHMQLRLDVLDSNGPQYELADRKKSIQPSASPYSQSPRPMVDNSRVLERIASETAATRGPDSGTERRLSFERDPARGGFADHESEDSDSEHRGVRRRKPAVKKKSRSVEDALVMERHEKLAGIQPGEHRKTGSDVSVHERKHGEDGKHQSRQVLMSGVQLLEEGVAQVQNLGNKALANLVGLLNLENEDDSTEGSSAEEEHVSVEKEEITVQELVDNSKISPKVSADEISHQQSHGNETLRRLFMIFYFIYSQLRANTDLVCYFFFILVYVWNFSFLTLMFPAVLFLYALLVNPGPSQYFWLAMLIYIEFNILLQYCYQIHQQHCSDQYIPPWLKKFGIPGGEMTHSFVLSVLPLFLVYLATLVQSSIKARDGEWMLVNESSSFTSSRRMPDHENQTGLSTRLPLSQRIWALLAQVAGWFTSLRLGMMRYFQALTSGSEAPPHFVQVSMEVGKWPEAGIQPETIESGFNRLLAAVRQSRVFNSVALDMKYCSRVRVESIESSPDRPETALAVLEVIYVAPSQTSMVDTHHISLTPAADLADELLRARDENLLEVTRFPYPIISVIPGGKREVDLYAYIFGTELLTFLFVAFFYQPLMKHSSGLFDVTQVEDQFPKGFIIVLMTLFFLIVVDRVLYLSSFASGKVVYYLCTLVLYTGYVSRFVWSIEDHETDTKTKRDFHLLPLRIFYMMKALSLALQAIQIKYGLPHKSALYGQFLARKVNLMSWNCFRIYRALPFLFELRCVLDWSCTTTALNMYDWLKLEDIYGSLFLVQCDNKLNREKHRLGEKQGMWIKFCSGVLLFSILIGVIWAPMLIYSNGNPTNTPNLVMDVHAGISVKTAGGVFKLYETGLCHNHTMTDTKFPDEHRAILAGYDPRDVQVICCEPDGASLWLIPPATLKSLIHSIDSDDLLFSCWWDFHRERPKEKELASYPLQPQQEINVLPDQLKAVLNGSSDSIFIENFYPQYFRVPGSGDVHMLEGSHVYVSGNLTLKRESGHTWWSFERDSSLAGDCGSMMGPAAVTVSEEVPPKGLLGETLSRFSIWSLYITFVLAVGRFIRLQCADIRMRIPYENFPACDRLVAICEDIYAARAAGELELEEGLFWTLIKIYRAPYILMEYTKVE